MALQNVEIVWTLNFVWCQPRVLLIGRASNWGLKKRTYSKLIENQNVNHFHFELFPSEMKNVCSVSLFEKLTIKGKISLIWYGAPSVAKSLFHDIKRNVTKFIKCNEIQRNEIQMPWNKIPIPWNPIIEICPLPWLYKVRWSFRNAFVWFSFLPYPTLCGS